MQLTTEMKTVLMSAILSVCLSVVLGASLPGHHEDDTENMADLNPSETSHLSWLRYLLENREEQPRYAPAPEKRFSSFGMPYIKYRVDKRNNGVWIWMPAQGYVSVPKQQQSIVEDASTKQGKIMRYGK